MDFGIVHVHPIVRERIASLEDERDGQEVAVPQPLRRVDHVRRGPRRACRHQGPQRHRRHDLIADDRLAGRLDRLHALPVDPESLHRRAEADLASVALDRVRHRLPHLPGPVARIVEAADQAAAPVAIGLGAS